MNSAKNQINNCTYINKFFTETLKTYCFDLPKSLLMIHEGIMRTYFKALFISIISVLILGTGVSYGQVVNSDRTLSIGMSASEYLPADLIIFNINVNAEADTPQEAYAIHRERESLLAGLLRDLNIEEDNITFEPVQMNRRQIRNAGYVTSTNQSVSITFSDFSLYEQIQLTLIENDFDSFNGQFSSTRLQEGKEAALVKAIEETQKRAELIADASGVEIVGISDINYSEQQIGIPRRVQAMEAMSRVASDASMMDFSQTVQVQASVNISYFIQ